MSRERIVEFLRRYWREVLAVAVAVLLALLLTLRWLRVLRVVAVPALIGAILVVGWLLLGSPSLTIPRFTTEGPVVRNGVAVIVACGKKQGIEGMEAAMKYAPEPRTGGWWPVHRGGCTVWYHQPPLPEQRQNRHERAQGEREKSVDWSKSDVVRACGREVLPGYPLSVREDFARAWRKDCGIYGPAMLGGD